MKILVTGATGYIGGRLVHRLLERGHRVRVLVRDPRRLRGRGWEDRVEVHTGDLMEPASLQGCRDGLDAAYYLVHSMHAGAGFAGRDRQAARNFVEAAGALPSWRTWGGSFREPKRRPAPNTSGAEPRWGGSCGRESLAPS